MGISAQCVGHSCLHFFGFFFLISGQFIGAIVRQLDSQTTPSNGLWATYSWLAEHFRALINCKWLAVSHRSLQRKELEQKEAKARKEWEKSGGKAKAIDFYWEKKTRLKN